MYSFVINIQVTVENAAQFQYLVFLFYKGGVAYCTTILYKILIPRGRKIRNILSGLGNPNSDPFHAKLHLVFH